ncbi:hypothetical protein LCGC14_0613920 [marine sediment metagenome]|uniref:Uncharacterized protein n=1 Tax=marine sediment metagenome TaxID=412755 RepID=A0A0F9RR61_9ZZZZ
MTEKLKLAGQVFGRLLVLEDAGHRNKNGGMKWPCLCECGNETLVFGPDLVREKVRSCGCLMRETTAQRNRDAAKHKHTSKGAISPTYYSWMGMRSRCKINPEHKDYSHYKDVTHCDRWKDFRNFLEDMGERPGGKTLDRIDPYGNYGPDNCKWSTPLEQRHNRRS